MPGHASYEVYLEQNHRLSDNSNGKEFNSIHTPFYVTSASYAWFTAYEWDMSRVCADSSHTDSTYYAVQNQD